MKKITFVLTISILFLLFITKIGFGNIVISGLEVHFTLNGNKIPDSEFYATFVECHRSKQKLTFDEKFIDEDLIPQLKIKEYDPKNNCYWISTDNQKCNNKGCFFFLAPYKKYYARLAIYLPSQDKVYLSERINFFLGPGEQIKFRASLTSDGKIQISEFDRMRQILGNIFSISLPFIILALPINIIVESLTALIYTLINKISKRILIFVLLVNFISVPIFFILTQGLELLFILPMNISKEISAVIALFLSEILIFALEGIFIYLTNKKFISLKKALILSFLMNLSSLILGLLILINL